VKSTLAPVIDTLPVGVLRTELPTPFPVGPVCCYLLPDHPVTLIDPGMLFADTPILIKEFLASAGRTLSDVELVVVTHGHPDHFGAAGWVAQQSGAPIVCGRAERPKLTGDFAASTMTPFMEALGVPDGIREQFPSFLDLVHPLIHELRDDDLVLVDDLDSLDAGGRSWEVQVTPGHAVGHVSLFDRDSATLLAGDHLLAHITPNPVIEPDKDSPSGRRRSLVEYLDSLDRFVALGPAVVLPGHGPCFGDVPRWAGAVREHHERRAEAILAAVKSLGEPTAYELSCQLFPHIEGFSHMLGMSEVIGHLDLLAADELIQSGTEIPQRFAVA